MRFRPFPLALVLAVSGCLREDVTFATESTGESATASSSGGSSDGDDAGGSSSTTGAAPTSGEPTSGESTNGEPGTSGQETSGQSTTDDEALLPSIVQIDMPYEILASGPVFVRVHTQNATGVKMTVDDAETLYFKEDGYEKGLLVFSEVLPIFGSPDNGLHSATVTARDDKGHEDSMTFPFEVVAPPAGSIAWEKFGGVGSDTVRLAVTADGYVYEAGSREINGIAHPSLRLRDPISGADVWKDGARVLDAREGAAADVAVTRNGEVWVAMNVREGNTWHVRLARLTGEAESTGVEMEKPGATVTGIASDFHGGCIAVGFTVTVYGDSDALVWRMSAEGLPILSGYPWDYAPDGVSHKFDDLALDVAVNPYTDEAWIVGGSWGDHDKNGQNQHVRGVVRHVHVDTLDALSPLIVAPPVGNATQSLFHGAWAEADSVLVSGYQCDLPCQNQIVLATRYSAEGVPTWGYTSPSASVAIGHSIASDTHGVVLIAASIKDGATVRGYLLGRTSSDEAFAPVVFPGKGTSSATSVVVGPYDWPFVGGSVTVNNATQGYVLRMHP